MMTSYHFIRADWDSEFFAREIAELKLGAVPDDQSEQFFDLLWVKVSSDNYALLNDLATKGFLYVEGELSFCRRLPGKKEQNAPQFATTENIPELLKISENLYSHSRYREPWFSIEQRNHFYQTWLTKAVMGTFDHHCIVDTSAEGKIRGFVTLRYNGSMAKIGLLGVAREFRAQGVAKFLLGLAEQTSINHECTELEVSTQSSNLSAINLYIRQGYSLQQSLLWFYK